MNKKIGSWMNHFVLYCFFLLGEIVCERERERERERPLGPRIGFLLEVQH